MSQSIFEKALAKYGTSNFRFNVIGIYSINDIDDAERYWIKYFQATDPRFGYNLEEGGSKNKIISESTRIKMSIAQVGKKHSIETRKKISEVQKGKIITQETRQKMSKSRTGSNNSMFGRRGENAPSSKRVGILNPNFGQRSEDNPSAKLTFDIAQEIRKEYANGGTSSIKLAKKYGVSKPIILNILHNKSYTR